MDTFGQTKQKEELLGRVADILYEDARCGFFHDAMCRTRIYFSSGFGGALSITVPKIAEATDENGVIESIVVDTREFYRFIEGHLTSYVERLRESSQVELRSRFEQACRLKWDYGGTPPVIAW